MKGAHNAKVRIEKQATIARILDNPTYTKDSGMIVKLARAMPRFSLDELSSLELIIEQKGSIANKLENPEH